MQVWREILCLVIEPAYWICTYQHCSSSYTDCILQSRKFYLKHPNLI